MPIRTKIILIRVQPLRVITAIPIMIADIPVEIAATQITTEAIRTGVLQIAGTRIGATQTATADQLATTTRAIPLTMTIVTMTWTPAMASRYFMPTSRLRRYRNILSPIFRVTDIYGRRVIGVTLRAIIIGCQARGRARRKLAICGRRDSGLFSVVDIATTTVIGADTLATMAGLIMEMVIPAPAIRAVIGTEIALTTTAP